MSPGAIKVLLWAAVILLITYAFNINLPALISHVGTTIQQMHNTNGRG